MVFDFGIPDLEFESVLVPALSYTHAREQSPIFRLPN